MSPLGSLRGAGERGSVSHQRPGESVSREGRGEQSECGWEVRLSEANSGPLDSAELESFLAPAAHGGP